MEADSPPPDASSVTVEVDNVHSTAEVRTTETLDDNPTVVIPAATIAPGVIDAAAATAVEDPLNRRLNNSCEEPTESSVGNDSIHPFNVSNVTVIEKLKSDNNSKKQDEQQAQQIFVKPSPPICEGGSDSGVEVLETHENCTYHRALSSNSGNSQDFVPSCDSSIISCCSNYDEAYNLLVRRNSTLIEDYTSRHGGGDITSENGSESSSVTGSSSSRNSKRNISVNATGGSGRKRVGIGPDPNNKKTIANSRDRSKSKPPLTPKHTSAAVARLKSTERCKPSPTCIPCNRPASSGSGKKLAPATLDLTVQKRPTSAGLRTSSATRTPSSTQVTPTDDGRWPSVNSKPAPLMSKSLRGILVDQQLPPAKIKIGQMEVKTIEKYATLPRRRKEKSLDDATGGTTATAAKDAVAKRSVREESINRLAMAKTGGGKTVSRESTPSSSRPYSHLHVVKRRQKVKIYHETSIQTALTMADVDKALSGVQVTPMAPSDVEKCDKNEQIDISVKELDELRQQLKQLQDKYERLCGEHSAQSDKLSETESKLTEERLEKEGLKEELRVNTQRVLAILGEGTTNDDENVSSDSLLVLESRFQNVSQVVIRQEEEISRLNALCRSLHIDLEKSLAAQKILVQQQQELESESIELQEFMQAEKTTLSDALKEAESETAKYQELVKKKDRELQEKQEECKRLVKLGEQRWQENLSLQAQLGALEAKSRELLVHQGSSVSGTAVALSALIGRLEGLVDELVTSYSISEQELEDVIFHNEAYSNSSSSPDATPENGRKFFSNHDQTPSPKKAGSSFVSAVINAIKNAAAQSPFSGHHNNRDINGGNICAEHSSSNEMLDSETEPCLMMEHVLEDVVVPDGHSHNMISSCHSIMSCSSHQNQLSHSESLKDLSQSLLFSNRYNSGVTYGGNTSGCCSLTTSFSNDMTPLSDIFHSFSLVDQVIDVDNLVTKLLKVIRIIQIENDDCMNELQDQRDRLAEQVNKQKDNGKLISKQLKDWEALGAKLKTEVKELMQQLSKKNNEIDAIKTELNNQREQVEKLNQDVCELSTALAKAELETKMKEEEVTEAMRNWEKGGEVPTPDVLGRLIISHNEIPLLREKLSEKERHLKELTQEFLTSRQVLTESLKEAVNEAKKQYEAIDNALEVLHNNQNVVQQCPPLVELQRDLETTSFQSASAMPLAGMIPSAGDCNANAAALLQQAIANLQIASSPPINTTA